MPHDDRIAHCRARIEEEDRAAARAANDAAQRAHAQLAALYRRLEGLLVRSTGQPMQLPDATFLSLASDRPEPSSTMGASRS